MGAYSKKLIPRGSRIRVLVIDDSVVIRRLVTHALEQDPRLELVGTAPNGSIGLARIPQVNPDVITLDIEMPEMDGLEMLRHLRPTYPDLPVIMFSTLTERGAASTLEALRRGASDYVTKAANVGSLDRSLASLRDDLIPKIKQFFTLEEESKPASAPPMTAPAAAAGRGLSPAPSPVKEFRPLVLPKVVAIGVSTGGPNALRTILPAFPAHFPLPILVVQHMPPLFTRLLAERLEATSKLKVREATEGAVVEPGTVLIAPGDFHMRLRRSGGKITVALDQGPPENSCRPAVDVLFRSVQEIYGAAAISAVLTGMGNDGLRGAQALKGSGACVIAQDEASSVVWGMPGAVASAGLADAIVPLDQVVPEILRRAGSA